MLDRLFPINLNVDRESAWRQGVMRSAGPNTLVRRLIAAWQHNLALNFLPSSFVQHSVVNHRTSRAQLTANRRSEETEIGEESVMKGHLGVPASTIPQACCMIQTKRRSNAFTHQHLNSRRGAEVAGEHRNTHQRGGRERPPFILPQKGNNPSRQAPSYAWQLLCRPRPSHKARPCG